MKSKQGVARKPKHDEQSRAVERSLRRPGKEARKVACMHGTPVYYMKDGKIVAEKP